MDAALAGDGDIEITRAQNRNYLLGEGFHRMARESNSFTLLLRYQAQAERHYRRAIEEFDRLKSLREELPNEPIIPSDLEPTETTYPDLTTAPNPHGDRQTAEAAADTRPTNSRRSKKTDDGRTGDLVGQALSPANRGLQEQEAAGESARPTRTAREDVGPEGTDAFSKCAREMRLSP